jgi:hypothetical protein
MAIRSEQSDIARIGVAGGRERGLEGKKRMLDTPCDLQSLLGREVISNQRYNQFEHVV